MLLENFAKRRNQFAPFIYKTLTFLLIENFHNEKVRHHITENFIEIYRKNVDIPQSILLEPLLKQFQMSESSLECLNIFDMKLLSLIAQNKRLQISLVIQFLDLFGNIINDNLILARFAQISFINLIQNYQDKDEVLEYLQKYCAYCLSSVYKDLKNTGGRIILPPRDSVQNLEMAQKFFVAQKRALMMDTLKKIIIIDIQSVNDILKSSILLMEQQIRVILKTEYKGIILLLANFGQPNQLIQQFDKEYNSPHIIINETNSESSLYSPLQNKRQNSENNHNLNSLKFSINAIIPSNTEKILVRDMKDQLEFNSFTEIQTTRTSPNFEKPTYDVFFRKEESNNNKKSINQTRLSNNLAKIVSSNTSRKVSSNTSRKPTKTEGSDLGYISKREAKPNQKVLEDLEYIQNLYQLNMLKKINESEEKQELEDKTKEKIRRKLEKRRLEYGIASRNRSNVITNLIFEDGTVEQEKAAKKKNGLPEIQIVDLDTEETIYKAAIDMILEKYQKFLKFLFTTYANTGIGRGANNFQKYSDEARSISLSEIWRMLIEHDCKHFISKEEFVTLLRLVCTKIMKSHNINELNYEGFIQLIVQVALFIYSKPPKNLLHMPVFVSLSELLKYFRDSESRKGQKTSLYDHIDVHLAADIELEKYLNLNLKINPDFPLPHV